MTTGQVIIVDQVVAVASAVTWLSTGVAAATRRTRLAVGLFAASVLVTLTRVATVAVLAGRGWWFVQEKVLLGLPLLGAAVLLLLVVARRGEITASTVVLLLTTGYAAVAGVVVTLVAGYPLSLSTALIATSAVGTAALLTVRVVAPSPAGDAGLSRRQFLGLAGTVVAGTAATGIGLRFMPSPSVATGGGPARYRSGPDVSVADLRGANVPAPGRTRRTYTLTARTATVRLPSGRSYPAWTFNGQVPGPPITATVGDLIEVTLHNADIAGGVTLHWHGYDVVCGEDGAPGVTQDAVLPGEEFVYRFRAGQAGTYWYHTHQASHLGVRRGLFGTLVVTDGPGAMLDLTLPVHTFDGDVVLTGTDSPAAAGTSVRLRLINTDSDPHRFALAGTPFRVTAVDGRDLNQPGEVRDVGLRLAAGGRYDLSFIMPSTPVALTVDDDRARIRLGPDATAVDTSGWPELDLLRYGSPAAEPFAAAADRHFTLVLDRGVTVVDGRLSYAQTINGHGHPSVPDQLVADGDLVQFTVVNRGFETHPWHLHGHPVLIRSRNGRPASGSPLWMDTFDVRPGEVWEVAFRAINRGIWMNHCHNLPHAHQGMMLRLCYEGVTTPFGDRHHAHG